MINSLNTCAQLVGHLNLEEWLNSEGPGQNGRMLTLLSGIHIWFARVDVCTQTPSSSFMFSPRTWLQVVDGAVILGMIPGSRTEEGREEEGGGSRREEEGKASEDEVLWPLL